MIARFGLEGGEITWFSNTDVAGVAQSSALEKSKIVWFSNKQGPIFLRTFLLERHKEIVGALVLTLSRGR